MKLILCLYLLYPILYAWPTQNQGNITIGFDLKSSYGTAAISYPNGTAKAIARVVGNQDYQATMRKLSLWSSVHYAPPYYTPVERWGDWARQQKRKARKAIGLPASDDVAAISTLIKALRNETEKALGFTIRSASASIPRFPAIYDEDLYDSFEYVGLEYIQLLQHTYHGPLLLSETSAALAGHGLSLCPNFQHQQECWDGDDLVDYYYIVDYTKSSLHAYYTSTFSKGVYDIADKVRYNLDLGSDARHDNPKEEYYWEEVRKILLEPLLGRDYNYSTRVIAVGESSHEPTFRSVLNDVLTLLFKEKALPVLDEDALYVQAKGVAEVVRRAAYLPKPTKPENADRAARIYKTNQQKPL